MLNVTLWRSGRDCRLAPVVWSLHVLLVSVLRSHGPKTRRLICDSKVPVGVNLRVNDYLPSAQGVVCLIPDVSLDCGPAKVKRL